MALLPNLTLHLTLDSTEKQTEVNTQKAKGFSESKGENYNNFFLVILEI